MSYHINVTFQATAKIAKERNVIFYFFHDVIDEQSFKDYIRFLENDNWVVPNWDEEQPITWQDIEPHLQQEEQNILIEICKNKARKLLADSDWSVTSDVQSALQNPTDWLNYRETVRRIFLNPVVNPSFPAIPDVRWNL
jgi:hypothetical protein